MLAAGRSLSGARGCGGGRGGACVPLWLRLRRHVRRRRRVSAAGSAGCGGCGRGVCGSDSGARWRVDGRPGRTERWASGC
eukprot:scaffold30593_cov118-Isochrysis_galbana.AAC.4